MVQAQSVVKASCLVVLAFWVLCHWTRELSASFSPDGQKVVSHSDDKTVRIWSVVTGECEQTLAGHTGWVTSASFSPDGEKVVSASYDKTVRIWSVVTGECEQTLAGHTDVVTSASFSPDGEKIVSASYDKTVRIWSAVTGECEQTLGTDWSWFASFSPDGEKIVSHSYRDVLVWSVVTGWSEEKLAGHTDWVRSASFSPDGEKIVSACGDKTVRIWSVVTGECEQTLAGHTDVVGSASFSPDGEKIVSASGDKTVRIWSVATGVNVRTLAGHTDEVESASFSPDGEKIVSAGLDGTIRIWNVVTGECEQTLVRRPHHTPVKVVSANAGKIALRLSDVVGWGGWDYSAGDSGHMLVFAAGLVGFTVLFLSQFRGAGSTVKRASQQAPARLYSGEANGLVSASTTADGDGLTRSSTVVQGNTCPICLNVMVDACTLSCGHSGCLGCLESVGLHGSTRCPTCRAEHHGDLRVSVALAYNIERLYRSDQEVRADEVTAARLEHAETLLRFRQTSNALAVLRRAKSTATSEAQRAEIDAKIAAIAESVLHSD